MLVCPENRKEVGIHSDNNYLLIYTIDSQHVTFGYNGVLVVCESLKITIINEMKKVMQENVM